LNNSGWRFSARSRVASLDLAGGYDKVVGAGEGLQKVEEEERRGPRDADFENERRISPTLSKALKG
jgi:hypothetical protein